MRASGIKPFVVQGVATVGLETMARDAARRLAASPAGMLAVVDRDRVVGTLTAREIFPAAPLKDLAGTEVTVSELLSADFSFCFEDTQVEEVVGLMRDNHLEQLLVLDREGHVVGTVTLSTVTQSGAG